MAEHQRLDEKINSLKSQIKNFPNGKLICARNGKHYKWYQSDLHNKTYIPKKNRQLAEKLAAKKYSLLLLEELENEKTAIEFYLRHHHKKTGETEKLLISSPEYRKLLEPHFKPLSQELTEWTKELHETNPLHPEQLIHKGVSGKYLRSKSEVMIDMFLYTNKIPYRYEAPLILGGTTIYPDFTIRHPKTGEYIYFEHFGKMDDPKYARKAFKKLEVYQEHGIIPGKNLIMTFETEQNPLSVAMVEKIIEYYFI